MDYYRLQVSLKTGGIELITTMNEKAFVEEVAQARERRIMARVSSAASEHLGIAQFFPDEMVAFMLMPVEKQYPRVTP